MKSEFFAFGEILWDCLPSGNHPGGAPFNVASHVVELGASASLLSAVGRDPLGDEILEIAKRNRVDVEFVNRVRIGLPTGTVVAVVDANRNATYQLVQPVAWDEITVSEDAMASLSGAGALVFGSLASRSPFNVQQLDRLLEVSGPLKFFDVNLRPPFADPARIVELGNRADVLKLNHDEVGQIAAWIRTGTASLEVPKNVEEVAAACATLSEATGAPAVCVTMGAAGAALWNRGTVVTAPAPEVVVKDTVGAGDAFMACLMVGLTREIDHRLVLETACRLGAYVASQDGALPPMPGGMIDELRSALRAPAPNEKRSARIREGERKRAPI